MKTGLILLLFVHSTSIAHAAIVCEGTAASGDAIKVTLSPKNRTAKVERFDEVGKVELQNTFRDVDAVWDGHMTGLMTAPGISIKYSNMFGCIRDVTVTTNVRSIELPYIDSVIFDRCKGGSTPDRICLPRR